jgi:hypothetical protein
MQFRSPPPLPTYLISNALSELLTPIRLLTPLETNSPRTPRCVQRDFPPRHAADSQQHVRRFPALSLGPCVVTAFAPQPASHRPQAKRWLHRASWNGTNVTLDGYCVVIKVAIETGKVAAELDSQLVDRVKIVADSHKLKRDFVDLPLPSTRQAGYMLPGSEF